MQGELSSPQIAKFLEKMQGWNCDSTILKEFETHRQQVLAGALEAQTNYALLKDMEQPFLTLTSQSGLTNAPLLYPGIMCTLQALYAKSAFYRESRLISLLEKVVHAILATVERQVTPKELFTLLQQSKGKAKKVSIRVAQARMIINIISQNMFVKSWLEDKKNVPDGTHNKTCNLTFAQSLKIADKDIDYLKFARPETAYIHDSAPASTRGSYVQITDKKLAPHRRMEERMAILSEKKMWFGHVEMLIKTVEYAKSAAANIEAMCGTFAELCFLLTTLNPKLKLFSDAADLVTMYIGHELTYTIFELTSAETFESFVVPCGVRYG